MIGFFHFHFCFVLLIISILEFCSCVFILETVLVGDGKKDSKNET